MMKTLYIKIRNLLRRYRMFLVSTGLLLVLFFVFFWPDIVISIRPGELGVYYSRLFGGTRMDRTYEEGVHFIPPWDILYVYDVRIQEETQEVEVLTLDGLTVKVHVSLRYQIIRDRLPVLHQQIGPEYKRKVILPIMTSAVRQTIGSYRPDALYSTARQELQDKMLVDAVEELGRLPLIVHGFVVKKISLPEVLRDAIVDKLVAEQKYLRYYYILLEEREEAKRKAIEGQGIRFYQSLVNENMTENYLRYEGIQATHKLATSDNAKVVVVGSGKDGLPIILNTQDTPRIPEMTNATREARERQDQSGRRQTAPAASATNSTAAVNASATGVAGGGSAPNMREEGGWKQWTLRESELFEFMKRLDATLLNPNRPAPGAPGAQGMENGEREQGRR